MIEKYQQAFNIIKSNGQGVTRDEYKLALVTHVEYVSLLEEFYQLATSEDFWTSEQKKRYEEIRIKMYKN